MLTGDNGILNRAGEAKEETEKASALETVKLSIAGSFDDQGEYKSSLAKDILEKNLGASASVTEKANGKLKVEYKGYTFKIDTDGNVSISNGDILPDEYKKNEYIVFSGKQYINTEITTEVNKSCTYVLDFEKINSNGWTGVNGSMQLNLVGNGRSIFKVLYDGKTAEEKIYQDENLISSRNWGQGNWLGTIYIGRLYNPLGNNGVSGRLYSAKVYENEKLVRDFIPCSSTEKVIDFKGNECPEGTIGLYDLIEEKFYTNQGTGDFSTN